MADSFRKWAPSSLAHGIASTSSTHQSGKKKIRKKQIKTGCYSDPEDEDVTNARRVFNLTCNASESSVDDFSHSGRKCNTPDTNHATSTAEDEGFSRFHACAQVGGIRSSLRLRRLCGCSLLRLLVLGSQTNHAFKNQVKLPLKSDADLPVTGCGDVLTKLSLPASVRQSLLLEAKAGPFHAESDSYTDALNTPALRPHRKKRLVKKMVVDQSHLTGSTVQSMDLDVTPAASPERPARNALHAKSLSRGASLNDRFDDSLTKNVIPVFRRMFTASSSDTLTAKQRGQVVSNLGACMDCSSSMDEDRKSTSSISSNESDAVVTNDEGREGDDEQSDWFFEPSVGRTSPHFPSDFLPGGSASAAASALVGACGVPESSYRKPRKIPSPSNDQCMGVPPIRPEKIIPLFGGSVSHYRAVTPSAINLLNSTSGADSSSSTAKQTQVPSVPDSSDTDISQCSWICQPPHQSTNVSTTTSPPCVAGVAPTGAVCSATSTAAAKASNSRRLLLTKGNKAAFVHAITKKITRFLNNANQSELIFGPLKKREQKEITKLAKTHLLEIRSKSGRRKHGLVLAKTRYSKK